MMYVLSTGGCSHSPVIIRENTERIDVPDIAVEGDANVVGSSEATELLDSAFAKLPESTSITGTATEEDSSGRLSVVNVTFHPNGKRKDGTKGPNFEAAVKQPPILYQRPDTLNANELKHETTWKEWLMGKANVLFWIVIIVMVLLAVGAWIFFKENILSLVNRLLP
jgi:hypothetical protein